MHTRYVLSDGDGSTKSGKYGSVNTTFLQKVGDKKNECHPLVFELAL